MKSCLLMATFNGERFIKEQLDSIRFQTRHPDEVIICDDCSTDNTRDIISQYIIDNQLNESWKIIQNSENIGFRKNFHKLMSLAKYEIIFLSDQDDIWDNKKIESMMRCHEIIGESAVIVSDVNQIIEKKSKAEKIVSESIDDKILFDKNNDLYKIEFTQNNLKNRRPGWSFSFSKKLIPNIENILGMSNTIFHDEAIWYVGLLQNRLFYLNKNTGDWRKFFGSETSRGQVLSTLLKNNEKYFSHSISNLEVLSVLEVKEEQKKIIENEIKILTLRRNFIINGLFFYEVKQLVRRSNKKEFVLDLVKHIIIRFGYFFKIYS